MEQVYSIDDETYKLLVQTHASSLLAHAGLVKELLLQNKKDQARMAMFDFYKKIMTENPFMQKLYTDTLEWIDKEYNDSFSEYVSKLGEEVFPQGEKPKIH